MSKQESYKAKKIGNIAYDNKLSLLTKDKEKLILEKFKNKINEIREINNENTNSEDLHLQMAVNPNISKEERISIASQVHDILGISQNKIQDKCFNNANANRKIAIEDDKMNNLNIIKIADYIAAQNPSNKKSGENTLAEKNTIFVINEGKDIKALVNYISADTIGNYFSSNYNSNYFLSDAPEYISVSSYSPDEDPIMPELLYKKLLDSNREIINAKFTNTITIPESKTEEIKDPDCQSGYAVMYNKSTVNEAVRLKATQEIILYMFNQLEIKAKNDFMKKTEINAVKKFIGEIFAFPVPDTKHDTELTKKFASDKEASEYINDAANMLSEVYKNVGCMTKDSKDKKVLSNPIAMLANFKPQLKGLNEFRAKNQNRLTTITSFTAPIHSNYLCVLSAHTYSKYRRADDVDARNRATAINKYFNNNGIQSFIVPLATNFAIKSNFNYTDNVLYDNGEKQINIGDIISKKFVELNYDILDDKTRAENEAKSNIILNYAEIEREINIDYILKECKRTVNKILEYTDILISTSRNGLLTDIDHKNYNNCVEGIRKLIEGFNELSNNPYLTTHSSNFEVKSAQVEFKAMKDKITEVENMLSDLDVYLNIKNNEASPAEKDDSSRKISNIMLRIKTLICRTEDYIKRADIMSELWTPEIGPIDPIIATRILTNIPFIVGESNKVSTACLDSSYKIRDISAILHSLLENINAIATPSGALMNVTENCKEVINILSPPELQLKINELVRNFWKQSYNADKQQSLAKYRENVRPIESAIVELSRKCNKGLAEVYMPCITMISKLVYKTLITYINHLSGMLEYIYFYSENLSEEDIINFINCIVRIPHTDENSLDKRKKLLDEILNKQISDTIKPLRSSTYLLEHIFPYVSSDYIKKNETLKQKLLDYINTFDETLNKNLTKEKLLKLHNCLMPGNEPQTDREITIADIYSQVDSMVMNNDEKTVLRVIQDVSNIMETNTTNNKANMIKALHENIYKTNKTVIAHENVDSLLDLQKIIKEKKNPLTEAVNLVKEELLKLNNNYDNDNGDLCYDL